LRTGAEDGGMDLLAIAIAVAFFAVLALLIEGIERI
jgi:hypothetical protein